MLTASGVPPGQDLCQGTVRDILALLFRIPYSQHRRSQTSKSAGDGQSQFTSCPPYAFGTNNPTQATQLQAHTQETVPTATSDYVTCTYPGNGISCTYSAQCGNLIANPDSSIVNGALCQSFNKADVSLRLSSGAPIERRSIPRRSIRSLQARAADMRRQQRG